MSYGLEYNSGGYSGGYANSYGGGFDPMGGGDIFGMAGGYMNDASGENASPEKKSKDKNSVFPLSVKQFLSANGDNGTFTVDNKELHVVKLIGYVEYMEEHSTNIVYKVNDGTGTVDCKVWIPKDKGVNPHSQIVVGTYIRIYGNPREYEGKRELLVYDVCPITDWNEVTHHLLDCILTHLQHTKGPLKKAGAHITPAKPSYATSAMTSSNQYTPSAQMSGMNLGRMPAQNGPKTDLSFQIIEAFREGNHSEQGLDIMRVIAILRSRGVTPSMAQVESIVRHLEEEGALYSTYDNCYKLTME